MYIYVYIYIYDMYIMYIQFSNVYIYTENETTFDTHIQNNNS